MSWYTLSLSSSIQIRSIYDKLDALQWSGKFTERSMNEAVDIDFNVKANGSGSDSAGL